MSLGDFFLLFVFSHFLPVSPIVRAFFRVRYRYVPIKHILYACSYRRVNINECCCC